MENILKATAKSSASLIMRVLTASGCVAQSWSYFENWRRPEGCTCSGCRAWASVQAGESTVEELGQDRLRCEHRFLAWKDKTLVHQSINPVMSLLWAIIFLFALWNPFASLGAVAIVTTVGKNDILNQYFTGSAYTAAWYIGLVDGGSSPTYAAGDTMASHSGWTENVGYSNSTRLAWSSSGAASGGSIANTAATFNMNATGTIAGSFMTTGSAKSGTTGTLYSESNFTQGNRSVVNGDTLNSTDTETMS